MGSFGGDHFACFGFKVKRNRSAISRRPCPVSKFLHAYARPLPHTFALGNEQSKEDEYFRPKTAPSDGLQLGSENKLKKLKLKLGGVTHTISTQCARENGQFTISKAAQFLDAPQPQAKETTLGSDGSLRRNTYNVSVHVNKYEAVRKSKRVPKRRVIDVGFIEDDDDEELHFLGRKNSRIEKFNEDKAYMEEEEPSPTDEPGCRNRKLGFVEGMNESTFTRNRALQSAKDVGGATLIEFPDGLPPVPSKRQKAKLSEVEQQLKKAEAAQRRKLQSEKAAKEAEAEAIRKILGHDSVRKKEEKMRKQRDGMAQGKAGKLDRLGSNTVRCVTGPTGTVVTFSDDIGLPDIFNSVPCRYPPPREKCAGPNCSNAYKYRDSKSKLPLCSLHCYKAIHGKIQPSIIC